MTPGEQFFRQLVEQAQEVVVVLDEKGRISYVNKRWSFFTGYTPEETVGRLATDFIDEKERRRADLDYSRALGTDGAPVSNHFTVRAKDGSRIIFSGVGRNFLSDPVIRGFVMYIHPVTEANEYAEKLKLMGELDEKVRLQDSLRESERKFRSLVENSVFGVYLLQRGRFVYVNPRFVEMTGYSVEELMNHVGPEKIIHPDDLPMATKSLRERLAGIKPVDHYFFRLVTKSGEIRHMEVYSSRMEYRGKPAAIVSLIDVTEKLALEERLSRVEKLEGMISVAGGVAHDLNNVLGALFGYTELLTLKVGEDSPYTPYLTKIMESSRRGAAIVDDLLTLTRRGVRQSQPVDVNEAVRKYLTTPEYERLRLHHPQARLEVNLEDNLPKITGSYIHILKSIMNLVSNAVEAMPEGGTVKVRTFSFKKEGPEAGKFVVLEVADEGVGIGEEDMKHIFEPFYTKKVMGRSGTGLGLTVVWSTVRDHGGYIEVESKRDAGTVFQLFFPVRKGEERPVDSETESAFKGKGEKILVVDDVPAQRDLARVILSAVGYEVEEAGSGKAAIEKVKKSHYDLVIIDMLMEPGLDGLDTYQGMLMHRPHQKAIIVSGYGETDRVGEAMRLGAGSFLKKPYSRRELLQAVRDVFAT